MTPMTQKAPRTWRVRPLDMARDKEPLLRLMAEVYGADHRSASEPFLRWQYLDNPLGLVVGAVAEATDGEVVGAYTLIPLPFRVDGRERLGMLSLNTATSPRYQGQGIFTALAKVTYDLAAERGAVGVL